MAFKFVLSFCAVLAAANAGFLQPAVTTYTHGTPIIAKLAQPSIDAVAATQQNVVRSFGGTVSTYSKNVVTPYSSVSKSDSRITNNVYTPAVAKTLTYAAPTQVTYAASAPVYAAPVTKTVSYAAPAPVYAAPVTKTVSYAGPAQYYSAPLTKTLSYAAPAQVYSAPLTKTVSYAAPAPVYAAPLTKTLTYSAPAPVVTKTLAYAAPTAYTKTLVSPVPTVAAYTAPAPILAKQVYSAAAPVAVAKPLTYAAPLSAPVVYSNGVHYSPAATVAHVNFDGFGSHWGW